MATVESIARPFFFFFNDTATTEIYTLSLHDALPIFRAGAHVEIAAHRGGVEVRAPRELPLEVRSEEHTSELQSQSNLVCRLLLEKKKTSSACIPEQRPRSDQAPRSANGTTPSGPSRH